MTTDEPVSTVNVDAKIVKRMPRTAKKPEPRKNHLRVPLIVLSLGSSLRTHDERQRQADDREDEEDDCPDEHLVFLLILVPGKFLATVNAGHGGSVVRTMLRFDCVLTISNQLTAGNTDEGVAVSLEDLVNPRVLLLRGLVPVKLHLLPFGAEYALSG